MEDYDKFLNWLSANGITDVRRTHHYALTIKKIMDAGITEKQLLFGDIVAVIDEYVKITDSHYTKRTYGQYRYVVRKYREYRGIPEQKEYLNVVLKPATKPISDEEWDEIVKGLVRTCGISSTYANTICSTINKLMVCGISEQDILGGETDALVKRYNSLVIREYKDTMFVRRVIAYYRMYKGVPVGDAGSERLILKNNRRVTMTEEDYKEKDSFTKWFNSRFTARDRASAYYYDICRIRDSGISEIDMLKDDERDTCDRYCRIKGVELSRSMMKEYRKAVRLYQIYVQAVAE